MNLPPHVPSATELTIDNSLLNSVTRNTCSCVGLEAILFSSWVLICDPIPTVNSVMPLFLAFCAAASVLILSVASPSVTMMPIFGTYRWLPLNPSLFRRSNALSVAVIPDHGNIIFCMLNSNSNCKDSGIFRF